MQRWRLVPAVSTCVAAASVACASVGCGTSLDLGSNDAGVPYDADCKIGTYAGSYACTAASGSPVQFSTSGDISVTLVPAGATRLALPPDASLSTTNSGTTETSALSGALDCPSRKLTGTLSEVAFMSSTFKGTISGGGEFSATYDADASPPALIDGVMDPPPTLGTTCSWSAQLK